MDVKAYKQQLLDQLYAPYIKCKECPLGLLGRTNVVFGEGNPDAALMFIGEGPGQNEDTQGRPFVGRAGQLLNSIFERIGIERSDVFITNIVKCRPPSNRKPLPLEMNTCKSILLINQIKIIRPKVICTLGSTAIAGLIENPDVKITAIRGKVLAQKWYNACVLPTYHPAYVLRNTAELETLYQDIKDAFDLANAL